MDTKTVTDDKKFTDIQNLPENIGDEPKKEKKKKTKAEKRLQKIEKRKERALQILNKKKDSFRAYLERELKYGQLTEKKAYNDWMAMSVDNKYPEQQTEIEMFIHEICRMQDKKTTTINALLGDLDIANEQYDYSFKNHRRIINFYKRVLQAFVTALRNFYDSECYLMMNYFYQEIYSKEMREWKTFFENLLHATNVVARTKQQDLYQKFIVDKDILINKSVENQFYMREETIKVMTDLSEQMKLLHDNIFHGAGSQKRYKMYNALSKKQDLMAATFENMENLSKKIQRKSFKLQKKLLDVETSMMYNISNLKHELTYLSECYWILKNKAQADFAKDNKLMNNLAGATNTVCRYLKKLKKRGDHLIGIAATCRRLQTEKEKVLPWPEQLPKMKTNIYSNDLSHIEEMELFWYKVSLAKTHNIAIKKEKKRLIEENNLLKKKLELYCHMQGTNAVIRNLNISQNPTCVVPCQEIAHNSQTKNNKIIKDYNKNRSQKK